ncbi:MAG: ATP-binding protein [Alphaproteobacteria bacterium]
MSDSSKEALLRRVAEALERLSPPARNDVSLESADGFVWHADGGFFEPVKRINRVELELLKGIDRVRDVLLENTQRFAAGLPANNALLWGARGMGKSSLIKAVHAAVNGHQPGSLVLIEIHREEVPSLPHLLTKLRESTRRVILFCDDLSFQSNDTTYKSLKAVLEGGIEGRPANAIFYATSNRRHMMARDMIENESSTAIHPSEAVEESVSLSDRFGLWLGFHTCDQQTYFDMIDGYVKRHGIEVEPEELKAEAIEWSMTRGARSGRVAWQFVQNLAGRKGTALKNGED